MLRVKCLRGFQGNAVLLAWIFCQSGMRGLFINIALAVLLTGGEIVFLSPAIATGTVVDFLQKN